MSIIVRVIMFLQLENIQVRLLVVSDRLVEPVKAVKSFINKFVKHVFHGALHRCSPLCPVLNLSGSRGSPTYELFITQLKGKQRDITSSGLQQQIAPLQIVKQVAILPDAK